MLHAPCLGSGWELRFEKGPSKQRIYFFDEKENYFPFKIHVSNIPQGFQFPLVAWIRPCLVGRKSP